MRYLPFGGVRSSSGTLPTDKKFTGQRLDETGLYFYNARYYDATIGSFVSADIILPDFMNPQSLNRYAYCYNNPYKYVDVSGHFGWLAAIGIGAIVGAVINTAVYAVSTIASGGDLTAGGVAEAAVSGLVAGAVSAIPIPGIQALASSAIMGAVGGLGGYLAGEGAETAASSIAGNDDESSISFIDAAASTIGGAGGAIAGEASVAGVKGLFNIDSFGEVALSSLTTPASVEGLGASSFVSGIVAGSSSGYISQNTAVGLYEFCEMMSYSYDSLCYSTAEFWNEFTYAIWSYYDANY
jgi:RHS repeat-associated protein